MNVFKFILKSMWGYRKIHSGNHIWNRSKFLLVLVTSTTSSFPFFRTVYKFSQVKYDKYWKGSTLYTNCIQKFYRSVIDKLSMFNVYGSTFLNADYLLGDSFEVFRICFNSKYKGFQEHFNLYIRKDLNILIIHNFISFSLQKL